MRSWRAVVRGIILQPSERVHMGPVVAAAPLRDHSLAVCTRAGTVGSVGLRK